MPENPVKVDIESMPEDAPDTPAEERAKTRKEVSEDSEEALRSKGQRDTSILWERIHAAISVIVTFGTIFIVGWLILTDGEDSAAAFQLLSSAFFMVVASYFARTNHTKVGGVGKEYTGR